MVITAVCTIQTGCRIFVNVKIIDSSVLRISVLGMCDSFKLQLYAKFWIFEHFYQALSGVDMLSW